jgi:hypothetical protein
VDKLVFVRAVDGFGQGEGARVAHRAGGREDAILPKCFGSIVFCGFGQVVFSGLGVGHADHSRAVPW